MALITINLFCKMKKFYKLKLTDIIYITYDINIYRSLNFLDRESILYYNFFFYIFYTTLNIHYRVYITKYKVWNPSCILTSKPKHINIDRLQRNYEKKSTLYNWTKNSKKSKKIDALFLSLTWNSGSLGNVPNRWST